MTSARCIICERQARWASALRRPLLRHGVRVVETRGLEDCWREMEAHPASVVGVEVTRANLASVVRWLLRAYRAFPAARMIACADRDLAPAEWLLREAGAVHVQCSPRDTTPLLRLIQRHCDTLPARPDTLREQIWQRLPWGDGPPGEAAV